MPTSHRSRTTPPDLPVVTGPRPAAVGAGPPRGRVESLLAEVGDGRAPAFELLYDEVANRVFATVRRVLVSAAESEEVTQEVLLEVWRTAHRFDAEKGSAESWITVMARRRAIDRVRASEAARTRDLRHARLSHRAPYDEVVEAAEGRDEREAVRAALHVLSEAQREAVHCVYFLGHTQEQAATRLGLPLGTVKTRLRDGLIRLRGHLAGTTAPA